MLSSRDWDVLMLLLVIPAKAGIHFDLASINGAQWTRAFARMTIKS